MAKYVRVASKNDLKDGDKKEVQANGMRLLLARVGDKYYACQAHCPHWGWPLVRGKLEGTILQCSFHFSRFDISNGKVIRWTIGSDRPAKKFPYGFLTMVKPWRPKKLKTYKVKTQDSNIMVQV